jgi:sugar/nucleoside kinase (ribokinase family)
MQYLIGSHHDFTVIPDKNTAIVTEGANGVTVYSASGTDHFPAIPIDAVDATGAGDAFAAGLLLEIGRGKPLVEGVQLGIAWAAATVQTKSSLPTDALTNQSGINRQKP